MGEYITDQNGTWKVDGICRMLVEPSEIHLMEQEHQEEIRQGQELLDSLIPSADEIRKAETEIQIIELLQEVGVI